MASDQRPVAIFLMGPTASGKTALACELASRFALDIVSVDSALVYRGMDIGAAKPDAATLARFPHRLVDIREAWQPYSAADFAADALREMQATGAAGRVPLLVGGTGLYFRALQSGLSAMPRADAALRARLAAQARETGWAALHERLRRLDPRAAERIHPADAQRIQRALEVVELTGEPMPARHAAARRRFGWRVLKLSLTGVERAVLHERIAVRVDAMLQAGLLDEVRALQARAAGAGRVLDAELPAMRAVGYRQASQSLATDSGAVALRERIIFATRQLAKRQFTWLRAELDARALPAQPERTARRALDDFLG